MITGRLTFGNFFFAKLRGWAKQYLRALNICISCITFTTTFLPLFILNPQLSQRKFHKCVCSTAKWPGCYKHTWNNIWKEPCGQDSWLPGADAVRQQRSSLSAWLGTAGGCAATGEATGTSLALCRSAIFTVLLLEPATTWPIQKGRMEGKMGHFLK